MLTGPEILNQIKLGNIVIDPAPKTVNPNSVNLRLGKQLMVYQKVHHLHTRWATAYEHYLESMKSTWPPSSRQVPVNRAIGPEYMPEPLDCAVKEAVRTWEIPKEGEVLWPGVLYLACTEEYTETHGFIPSIEGRSSAARLGIQVHLTAGFGDVGFKGDWTLEILVVHPVKVYAGMEICQIAFAPPAGEIQVYSGKYQNQRGPKPSGLWKDFQK